ncbi:TRAP transporter small permease subunit [Aestuariibius insulae]|uniref:TRAP transporter small permease subunit n=1 Tax=Aestuariibius insulae TaxID=2058287 RepID=UPI00345EC526
MTDTPDPLPAREDPGSAEAAGLYGRAINAIGVIFAIGILASAGILFLEVILRYGLNRPTIWAHEMVIFLNAAAFVFGGLYVAARDAHIRVVLIYDQLSGRLRRIFNVVISIVCALSSAAFAAAMWTSVARAVWTPAGDIRFETTGSAWDPPTPGLLKLFLFVVLILLAIQFTILAINYARGKGQ